MTNDVVRFILGFMVVFLSGIKVGFLIKVFIDKRVDYEIWQERQGKL